MSKEQNLGGLVEQLETAWNRSDSVAFAAPFADDADFIHILGGHFVGRVSIEKGHRAIFDTVYKGSKLKFVVEKIRFASPDVALIFASGILTTSHPGIPPQINARPTLVLQKREGAWQIIAFQNTRIAPEGAPPDKDVADQHQVKELYQALER
jgi:uncharacterized protein (TIGR02246 family)